MNTKRGTRSRSGEQKYLANCEGRGHTSCRYQHQTRDMLCYDTSCVIISTADLSLASQLFVFPPRQRSLPPPRSYRTHTFVWARVLLLFVWFGVALLFVCECHPRARVLLSITDRIILLVLVAPDGPPPAPCPPALSCMTDACI